MRRERHTIFLCWLLLHRQLSTQPTRGTRSAQTRLASPSSESQLSRSEAGTQLTAFSQIPKILSPRFRCMTSFTPPGPISYLEFYFDICEWCILPVRGWTPALMLHLTNPCDKGKVLSLTKPKGKIYKTKSLGNYITDLQRLICHKTQTIVQSAGAVRPPPNECPGYDTKQSDGEFPAVLELWGMQCTPSLPSLPGPLWPGVVALDRALSMGWIEITAYLC